MSLAVLQTCVIRLLRNSFRYAGRQHYEEIAKALRPVCTAPTQLHRSFDRPTYVSS